MQPLKVDPETGEPIEVNPQFDYVSNSRLIDVGEIRGANLHDLGAVPPETRFILNAVSADGDVLWEQVLTAGELLVPQARIVFR